MIEKKEEKEREENGNTILIIMIMISTVKYTARFLIIRT